ncbi:uncharacterized protein LOC107305147 [Oryza brachyantha]|uniref:uncharacterized protein LOC107305147 n=1 Tax=Oryza brachyantha TaxID=4533 RepID=UPI0007764F58|nr:uncharacterized protein LOC107305147 [Oryza brachyantha]
MAAGQGRPPTPPSSMVSDLNAGHGRFPSVHRVYRMPSSPMMVGLRMSSPVPVHATPSLSPSLQAGFRPPVHRVGLAPPRPGASTLCGDVQETGSRADEVTNIADAMSGAAATDKLYLGWNVGEQQYMRQERNENSLMHRWSTIQEAVNKYCGYLSKIQERNESGVRLDDQEMQARIWYKKGDEHQRTFNFMNCYRLLKNQQKWMVWMAKRAQLVEQQKNPNKRQKSTTNAAPVMSTDVHAAAIGDVAANGQERPPGRKKEKEKLAKRSDQSRLDALTLILAEEKESDADKKKERSERYARAFSLQEQKIAIQKEEFELRKMLEEERIVRMDTSEMPADQQEFYKILKQQIIARRTINLDSS